MVTSDPFYKAHWRDIGPDRMAAYRGGFNWDKAADALYDPAQISLGQKVADFGCGPGHIAAELARRVGPEGHVYLIDINAEFLDLARENAAAAGVLGHVSAHLNDGATLPLGDATLDRFTARNTLMYVDDPADTLEEVMRVLRPGGLAHAVDGDWFMMVAEPVAHEPWRAFVEAAAYACRNADMGRKLHTAFRQAGFADVNVRIVATADTEGRLLGMIRKMAAYAAQSGRIPPEDAEQVLQEVGTAVAEGTYLVVSPQFVVTGRK